MSDLILYKPLQPFLISQRFGENQVPTYKQWGLLGHPGLDCVRPVPYSTKGSNVRAAAEGTVTFIGYDTNQAFGIVVTTDNAYSYPQGFSSCQPVRFKHIYWHLDPQVLVKLGDKVKIGDILGPASNTGLNINPHLHFGLKPLALNEATNTWYNAGDENKYGGNIDPEPYLSNISAYEFITSSHSG